MRVLAWALAALLPHAAIAAEWTLIDLGTLGGSISYGAAVSNSGYVAGCAEVSAGVFHAFVYSNGSMRDLDPGGAAGSCANAVNDDGVAAGGSSSGEGVILTPAGVGGPGVEGRGEGVKKACVARGGAAARASTHAIIFSSGA